MKWRTIFIVCAKVGAVSVIGVKPTCRPFRLHTHGVGQRADGLVREIGPTCAHDGAYEFQMQIACYQRSGITGLDLRQKKRAVLRNTLATTSPNNHSSCSGSPIVVNSSPR